MVTSPPTGCAAEATTGSPVLAEAVLLGWCSWEWEVHLPPTQEEEEKKGRGRQPIPWGWE